MGKKVYSPEQSLLIDPKKSARNKNRWLSKNKSKFLQNKKILYSNHLLNWWNRFQTSKWNGQNWVPTKRWGPFPQHLYSLSASWTLSPPVSSWDQGPQGTRAAFKPSQSHPFQQCPTMSKHPLSFQRLQKWASKLVLVLWGGYNV